MTEQAIPESLLRAKALVDKLWTDKDLGAAVRFKAKEQFGNDIPPTIDEQLAPVLAPLKEENAVLKEQLSNFLKERAEEKKASEEKSAQLTLEQALDKARKDYSLTDEGFNKMVERMKETGNYRDAEAAAAWVASKSPPPPGPGPTWQPQRADFYGSQSGADDWKLLHKDPEGFLDKHMSELFRDPEGYVAQDRGF
jgi:hypothetical protein